MIWEKFACWSFFRFFCLFYSAARCMIGKSKAKCGKRGSAKLLDEMCDVEGLFVPLSICGTTVRTAPTALRRHFVFSSFMYHGKGDRNLTHSCAEVPHHSCVYSPRADCDRRVYVPLPRAPQWHDFFAVNLVSRRAARKTLCSKCIYKERREVKRCR